jgi:hypothetical protein
VFVGLIEGIGVGPLVGTTVGSKVGAEGLFVGVSVGPFEGLAVGACALTGVCSNNNTDIITDERNINPVHFNVLHMIFVYKYYIFYLALLRIIQWMQIKSIFELRCASYVASQYLESK